MAAPILVGLDIGSTAVRAVETSRERDRTTVTNVGHAVLPVGAVSGGVVQDAEAVTTVLSQMWTQTKFRTREVMLSATNHQTIVREMTVANLPERELRASLPFQVRDTMPLPVDRSILDFWPLEDPGTGKTVRGLLIAAPKEPIVTAVNAVERAGLHVVRVDLGAFALLRAVSRLDAKIEAIIDIGARTTSVVVHDDGEPLIVRTIPRGGHDITEQLAKQMNIGLDEAEGIKCRVGLRAGGDGPVIEVIRLALRPLISELRSSFAYLTAGEKKTRVARLAISGGGSLLPGLADTLGAELEVHVVAADATARVQTAAASHGALDAVRASAAVSIGLTLGAA